LNVILIGCDLDESRAYPIELRSVGADEAGESSAPRLERTTLIAADVEQSRREIAAVSEEGGEDCIASHSAVRARRDAQEEVRRFRGCDCTEIADARLGVRACGSNVRSKCNDVAIGEISDDSRRSRDALIGSAGAK
jgi:hypothetical protein